MRPCVSRHVPLSRRDVDRAVAARLKDGADRRPAGEGLGSNHVAGIVGGCLKRKTPGRGVTQAGAASPWPRSAPLSSRYFSGSTVVLEEPSGADCMPGGVWPIGLWCGGPSAVPVVIGPVQPCGCFTPFVSGTTVRPVLQWDLSVSPGEYPGLTGSLLT